jgi:hypothetical protein
VRLTDPRAASTRFKSLCLGVALLALALAVAGFAGEAQAPANDKPAAPAAPTPTADTNAFENSLGMRFVPVAGTKVRFSIWKTRVQDYEAFRAATGRAWSKPGFAQGPTHPAVNLSADDASAFCAWLTNKERREGRLAARQRYRLPTDLEWSTAV